MEASEKTTKIETNQGDEIPSNSFWFFSVILSGDMVVSKDTSPMFLINDDEVARYAWQLDVWPIILERLEKKYQS